MQYNIVINACPDELRFGLQQIVDERSNLFSGSGLSVTFVKDSARDSGATADATEKGVTVNYANVIDAFRVVGRLLGADRLESFDETPKFKMVGVMLDVSRNAVFTLESCKTFVRRLALMGTNMLMLYTEDTFEVPDEPFFGYLRGRYTYDELKELDDYAFAFGVELLPCIQALGHFVQVLQWPAYAEVMDTNSVLLADDEKTYAFLETIISAASAPYRSNRIHLGMDEADSIGTGRYRQIHGEKRQLDIFNSHLTRVRDICKELGLRPMIWSDMYFRLGSKKHDYYDVETKIPDDVKAKIPKGVDLVYWDYYHDDQALYEKMFALHHELGSAPLFQGGVWTWGRLWANLPYSRIMTNAGMQACKTTGIHEVITSIWGDDGTECDMFSALAGLQLVAEHAYADEIDEQLLRKNFSGSCNADYDAWVSASAIDMVPCLKGKSFTNVSKWMLWQDPLLSIMDPIVEGAGLEEHYAALAASLSDAAATKTDDKRLEFPASIAKVLSLKCELRNTLVSAYKADDSGALKSIIDGRLAELRIAVDELWRCHRAMWHATYKPFGWEVIEGRYGGLRARLETVRDRLLSYLDGAIDSIPELEVTLEKNAIPEDDAGGLPYVPYSRVVTPSTMK
jgi:hexosaminidase